MRTILYLAAFLLLSFSGATLTAENEARKSIKIGAILTLTGDFAMQNNAFKDGIELAVHEVNSAGGVKGVPLSVIYEDSKFLAKEANTAAKRLIAVEKVRAAINASVIEAQAAGYDFKSAEIPSITLWDASEDIEKIGPYMFSIGLWTPSSGEEAARFSADALGARTAVIMNTQDEWSLGATENFQKLFESRGGRILRTFTFTLDQSDFRTPVSSVKSLNPDVLYAPVALNFTPLFKQLRAIQFSGPIITSDLIADVHLKAEPGLFEGVYQTQVLTPSGREARAMVLAFEKYFGRPCDQLQYVAWGYDAVMLLAHALKRAEAGGEALRKALAGIRDFPGASGEITFNERGSAPRRASMFQVRNNKIVPVSGN